MSFVEVLKKSEIKEGLPRKIQVNGKPISVAKSGEQFYAFDDVCTHEYCSLSDGFVEGQTIECPCHCSKFDMTTGEVLNLPAPRPIKVYPLKIEGDCILVDVE